MIKYYSDKLNKFFASEKECAEAEKAHEAHEEAEARLAAEKKALSEKRAERAKEIEESYKKLMEARKEYNTLMNKFLRDYGSYHKTMHLDEPFFDFIDFFWG